MWTDRRPWVAIAAASLLVNVFLGGAVLGRVFERRATGPRAPAAGPLVTRARVDALAPDERARFRAAMAPHRPSIRAAREAHRAARREVEADLSAPSYDRAKVEADFTALRQTNRAIDEAVDAALVDALAGLPEDSRARLVSHLRAGPARPTPPDP